MALKQHLEAFLNHVDRLKEVDENGETGFSREFQSLKNQSLKYRVSGTFPTTQGERPENKAKNRYRDILPFDYTRVKLPKLGDTPGSDYINANFLKGASSAETYIAAQGPLPGTVTDFWRMVWQYKSTVIVMACKERELGQAKCEHYWPKMGDIKTCGILKITLLSEEHISEDFVVRHMKVTDGDVTQRIHQFHYTAWPDHGVPDSTNPILDMLAIIHDYLSNDDGPIVVHCSAGCGRTGAICAIDYAWGILKLGRMDSKFSLYSIISEMRKQRPSIVQAKDQYELVHCAVAELFKQHVIMIEENVYENVDMKTGKVHKLPEAVSHVYADVALEQDEEAVYSDVSPTGGTKINKPKGPTRATIEKTIIELGRTTELSRPLGNGTKLKKLPPAIKKIQNIPAVKKTQNIPAVKKTQNIPPRKPKPSSKPDLLNHIGSAPSGGKSGPHITTVQVGGESDCLAYNNVFFEAELNRNQIESTIADNRRYGIVDILSGTEHANSTTPSGKPLPSPKPRQSVRAKNSNPGESEYAEPYKNPQSYVCGSSVEQQTPDESEYAEPYKTSQRFVSNSSKEQKNQQKEKSGVEEEGQTNEKSEYSYANPEALGKWSLQAVAREAMAHRVPAEYSVCNASQARDPGLLPVVPPRRRSVKQNGTRNVSVDSQEGDQEEEYYSAVMVGSALSSGDDKEYSPVYITKRDQQVDYQRLVSEEDAFADTEEPPVPPKTKDAYRNPSDSDDMEYLSSGTLGREGGGRFAKLKQKMQQAWTGATTMGGAAMPGKMSQGKPAKVTFKGIEIGFPIQLGRPTGPRNNPFTSSGKSLDGKKLKK